MRMMKGMGIALGALALVLGAQQAMASELNITAEYKGDVSKTAGQFTNTTPASGWCSDHPEYCPAGYFGLLFPWAGNPRPGPMGTKEVVAPSSDPRDGFYFGFDASSHSVTVISQNGKSHELSLSIDAIGFGVSPVSMYGRGDPLTSTDIWSGGRGKNCTGIAKPAGTEHGYFFGMWGAQTRAPTECYLPFNENTGVKEVTLDYINFRYTLEMDQPWTWEPGVYTGSYIYKIGPGKDLDFGNNFQGSAEDVTLNFTLTVKPDMYVKFVTGAGGVVNADLQPPGGWLNWQGQMPPNLSKEILFDFGSTAPVKIHLECEHPVGDSCGIVDTKGGGSSLGVDTLLSANRFTDDSGKQAIKSRLSITNHVFTPDAPGGTGVQPTRLLFKTQDGVSKQLQRGHQYSGRVTVVFDSGVTP
jgi:hypothetical protein